MSSMGSVSISVAPVPAKDLPKKKRTNRLAKLKQCKLDVRREQWLSQVKDKQCKTEKTEEGRSSAVVYQPTKHNNTIEKNNLSTRPSEDEDKGLSLLERELKYLLTSTNCEDMGYSDSSSPIQLTSSSSNSSSGSSCWSVSFSGEEEEEDDCLDDWEAIADALSAHENKKLSPAGEPKVEKVVRIPSPVTVNNFTGYAMAERKETTYKPVTNRHAWSANDALRPQSLPDPLKKHDIARDSKQHYSGGYITRVCQNIISLCTSCPICCEELDPTDSSFQPCSCGFRLCLFCHNRILEADARCPGCRKHYDS